MSAPVKLLIGAAVLVLAALGAAEAYRRTHASGEPGPALQPAAPSRPTVEAPPDAISTSEPEPDYAPIVQRNIFRPLVAAPKGPSSASGPPSTVAKVGTGSSAPGSTATPAGKPTTPAAPPDPLADLALTGVIQVGETLQALIEKISTKTGRYVTVNEQYEGFRVAFIDAASVVLEREGRQHTLRLGGKQLPEARPPAPPAAAPAPAPTPFAPAGPPAGPRAGGPGGFFGGDMLSWAESQPLSVLEAMYERYSGSMSPETRAAAQSYLQSRRARGR